METAWWLSIAAGVLLGGFHAFTQYLAHRMARRTDTLHAFMKVALGGMAIRVVLTLALAALALAAAPIEPKPFAFTLVAAVVGATVAGSVRTARHLPSS